MIQIHYKPAGDDLPVCAVLIGDFDDYLFWTVEPSQATCAECRAIMCLIPIR